MTSTDITIATEMEKISEGLPATDLARELLRFFKAYSSNGRDAQLLGQVFYRSLVVYDEIQKCMRTLQLSEDQDWVNFDKYTGAIPPLERVLLAFYLRDTDQTRAHLPPNNNVVEGITFIELWLADRHLIYNTLNDLSNGQEFTVCHHL